MKWLRPTISITNNCNLACKYCYLEASPSKKNTLKLQEIKEIIDLAALQGAEDIKWTGGEIFTCSILPEVIDYAYNLGIKSTLLTNGTILDNDLIKQKREMISRVSISIDGPKEITDTNRGIGTFQKVLKSIDVVSEQNIPITLMATLDRRALPNLSFFEELSNTYNIDIIKLGAVLRKGRADDWEYALNNAEAELLLKEMKRMYVRSHYKQKYGTNLLTSDSFKLYYRKILEILFETLWVDWNGFVSIFPPSATYDTNKDKSLCHYTEFNSFDFNEYFKFIETKLFSFKETNTQVMELYEVIEELV
ncbi:radical SAM protein [Culicoidibacter larvae]|nr:radical SAM protein [Culicoidibacter larvae]